MKKIAILGASEPHLPLYLKAKEMGLETYCFAWKEGAFCKDYADHYYDISILEKEKITEICLHEQIDGIISNALEIAVPIIAYISEKLGLNGIPYQTALRARNKYMMREAVNKLHACLQPNYHIFSDKELLNKFPIIIKPTNGSCSNGVTLVNCKEEIPAALQRVKTASNNNEILIEEFIEGREISVESISYHGQHYILTITDKVTTGAPYFVEIEHHQPSNLELYIQKRIKEHTIAILNALEITNGATHTELKINDNSEIYFIELGARGGGDFISYNLVQLSTGYDYVKGMINVALDSFIPPCISEEKYSGVYFLSQETPYIHQFIEDHRNEPWVYQWKIENTILKHLTKSQDRSGHIIYHANYKISIPDKYYKLTL